MNIIHVVPTIHEEASGPSYSVVKLCQALVEHGNNVRLAALDWGPLQSPPPFYKKFPMSRGPRGLGFSREMRLWLRKQALSGRIHIIHNHSLWMMPNVYPGLAVRGTNCQLVLSPRGTLSPWILERSKWAKRIFWFLFQRLSLKQAVCFHATAENEYQEIRALGLQQPVCIIPNGIDIPDLSPEKVSHKRTLLFLGRIHPTKGVDYLLRAWHVVYRQFPEWELEIVGPDNEGYLFKMKRLASKLRLERVLFRGPLYGRDKERAYQRADIFVLPTHSENFGLAVAESLACGTPAIVTKGAPWEGLEKNNAGWWIDIGVEPLVSCLQKAMKLEREKLAQMGFAGREWMKREFSWKRIGEMMHQMYQWLILGGDTPSWVRK